MRGRVPLVVGGNHTHSAFGEAVDAVAVSPADVGSACERAVTAGRRRALGLPRLPVNELARGVGAVRLQHRGGAATLRAGLDRG